MAASPSPLAECAFDTGGIGFTGAVPAAAGESVAAALFGESASRALVSVTPANLAAVLAIAAELGVPAEEIGRTGGDRLTVAVAGTPAIDCSVVEAEQIWANALSRYFKGRAA